MSTSLKVVSIAQVSWASFSLWAILSLIRFIFTWVSRDRETNRYNQDWWMRLLANHQHRKLNYHSIVDSSLFPACCCCQRKVTLNTFSISWIIIWCVERFKAFKHPVNIYWFNTFNTWASIACVNNQQRQLFFECHQRVRYPVLSSAPCCWRSWNCSSWLDSRNYARYRGNDRRWH